MDSEVYVAHLKEEIQTLRTRAAELEEEVRQAKEELKVVLGVGKVSTPTS
jgi:predicted  nucleic acid-binding Zn-ribbon protein